VSARTAISSLLFTLLIRWVAEADPALPFFSGPLK
jgi:hypothetical protein